ncbi:MAG: ArsA family ATPase, partial [Calditrichaeota bacterium]
MPGKPTYIFFLGKGGVGKSTSAALAALKYARQHQPVLLVSLDPAHNQSDIFARQFNEKLTRISEFLAVKEINLNQWIQKYLQEVQSQVSRSYTYLTALNLEKYLDVLKYSPGIEEYALLLAFNDVRSSATEFEIIVFDMPPTALALRFLGLPRLTLLWLEKLLD